jgi:methionine aminopeptidase
MGSDDVEAINAISGERCNPHPHNFTDRLIRPGDQAFFDILQSFMGYRTCYYRTFNVGRATPVQHDAYKRAREWLDLAIALIKPGVSTDRICSVWPKAQEFGFPDEMSALGLQFGQGLGLARPERVQDGVPDNGGADIDQGVAHQDGIEEILGPGQDSENPPGPGVAVPLHPADLQPVKGEESSLGA